MKFVTWVNWKFWKHEKFFLFCFLFQIVKILIKSLLVLANVKLLRENSTIFLHKIYLKITKTIFKMYHQLPITQSTNSISTTTNHTYFIIMKTAETMLRWIEMLLTLGMQINLRYLINKVSTTSQKCSLIEKT